MFIKMKTNKSINFIVIAMLLMICVIAFTACGGSGDSGESSDSRPELTLTTNIEGAGTVTGGGHFDYNEDLFINAEVNNGYHFLGWYYDNDLLSTSAEYNCKMWDKDVTLEAKFIALPDDYDETFGDMSPEELINRNFKLSVVAGMPNYGKISVNDGDNKVQYSSSEKSGTSIKARALTTSSQRFLGWFDEADNLVMTNAVFNFSTPSFDYTLTAKWECNCEYTYNKENKTYACDACGASNSIYEIADKNGFVILNNELVAYIGDSTEITIPDNVTTIGADVFTGNQKITSVNIPTNVKTIAANAFANCSSICNIVFEEGATVTEIGASAFKNCSSLTSISIPNSVTIIGTSILSGCSSLQSVETPFRGSSINNSKMNLGYIFGTQSYSGSKSIEQNFTAYYIPTTLKSVTVNGGMLEEYAFANCDMLTQIIINASITTVPRRSFDYCTSLTSITIPDSVTSIGSSAFWGCNSLTSVTIGDSVTSIDDSAFTYCHKLVEVINHSSLNITAGDSSNGNVGYYAKEIHKGDSKIVNYNDYLFYTYDGVNYLLGYGGNDKDLILPESYKGENYEIYEYAFYQREDITSVTIGNSVTSIGISAFRKCTSLTSVTIPDSVTSIGDWAFYNCASLTSVTIPGSVTSIGEGAFYRCTSLTSIKYRGTKTQWNAISKGSDWNYDTGSYTITYNFEGE